MSVPKAHLATKIEAASELQKSVLDRLQSQDDLEFAIGDTLDMKTNVALVVIIFLATQSAWFLTLHEPRHWHNIQIVGVAFLVAAGLSAMYVLVPRSYRLKLEPDAFLAWVDGVKKFYGDDAVAILEFMQLKEIEKTTQRFARNSSINARKSKAMEISFYCTMGALIINVVTLLGLAARWSF